MSSRSTLYVFHIALLLTIIVKTKSMPFDLPNEDEGDNDEMEYESDDDSNIHLIQGDIVPEATEDGIQNQAIHRDHSWPNGIVPYKMNQNIGYYYEQKIKEAMRVIESVSCMKFKERDANDHYFIRILRRSGGHCFSGVGRYTGEQYVNVGQRLRLDDRCYEKGTILHELMHSIGFFHEQSRTDRDDYVKIVWDNIEDGQEHNFAKTSDRDVAHLGTAYDYYSIMHYRWNAWASNQKKPTIKILDKDINSEILGTSQRLSPTDINEINKLYPCPKCSKKCGCIPNDATCCGKGDIAKWCEAGYKCSACGCIPTDTTCCSNGKYCGGPYEFPMCSSNCGCMPYNATCCDSGDGATFCRAGEHCCTIRGNIACCDD